MTVVGAAGEVVQSEWIGLFSITVLGENTATLAVGLDGGSAVAFGAADTSRIPALAAVTTESRKIETSKMIVAKLQERSSASIRNRLLLVT